MSYADAVAVVVSLRDDLRCPEWAKSPLTGVEAAQKAKGEERCTSASCARMREEVEATLASNEAHIGLSYI